MVGAGNGTDVAIALRAGVGAVDAVEIDPELVAIGEAQNPDAPYSDERVRVIVDDGRAFLRRTQATYDLVLYALPDSLTLVSGQANLRLESYLFTEESLAEVRDVLEPDGVFAMYNLYREPWLVARLAEMLERSFGVEPIKLFAAETEPVIPVVPLPQVAAPTSAAPPGASQSRDRTT